MKKTFYLLMTFIGLTIVGCQPMEEIQDEINEGLDNQLAVGDINYTLTEDDYSDLDLGFPNFSDLDDAKELIPVFLTNQYPTYGANSTANITFDIYDPIRVEDYTAVSADYAAVGLASDYVTGVSDIQDLLGYKFPQAEEGDYVELTYSILAEEKMYTLDPDDYDLIGEELGDTYSDPAGNAAQFNTFEIRSDRDSYWSEDMIVEALGVVIDENYGSVAGQLYNVGYATYNGGKEDTNMKIKFDGNSYVKVDTGTAYELVSEDYQLIASELEETYPDAAASMAEYENFEKRGSGVYWEDEMIEEALNILLSENFPSAAEGDKFAVTYDVYNGNAITETTFMIKSGDEFVIDEGSSVSTIEATDVYALTNESWNEPYTIPSNLYTEEFGQRFSNFGDEEDVAHYVGIYLESVYPYANVGDLAAVAYQFYNGEATVTEYSNFELQEDGTWDMVPSVKSSSLQFGNIDGQWIPDNTVRYTLAGSDYGLIAEELADEYPAPAGSMNQYGNFDRRSGNAAYWSDEMLVEAMNVLLDEIAPNAEEGQKYIVTFAIYNGANTTETLSLIKSGGEWIINEG